MSPRPIEDGTRRNVSLTVTYSAAAGEDRTAYEVRGVGGARVVTPATPARPGEIPTKVRSVVDYRWWNFLVPLLAGVGLLALARVRLSTLPAEVMARLAGTGIVPQPASTSSPSALPVTEKSAPYARLMRQSPLDEVPREIAFTRDEILIGRGEECDVIIPHSSISREHVRIKKLKPGYVIFDLKSRNGTTVNGRPIVENLLKDGMIVKIGDVEFVFRAANV